MTLPRLLLGVVAEPMPYGRHVDVHGERPRAAASRSGLPSPLVGEIIRSGLRGRGGGGFPLASKIEAVQRNRGTPLVVVNGTEGEPMSAKDRVLLETLPHLVLDGAFCLAEAIGTSEVVLAIDEGFRLADDAIRQALRERPDVGRRMIEPRVVNVPSGYVTGQETALVNFLNTGIPRPLTQPPRVSERGVGRRPTLMSNAETLAHVALLARHGAEWFREIGPEEEPGSVLVTLSGGVRSPGVYEIEYDSHLAALVDGAGGVTEPIRAFLFGGYAGSWVDGQTARTLRLSQNALRPLRASLGAGIIVALPQSACPVAEVARVGAYMSDESAHQCGPCVNGLGSIAEALGAMCEGRGATGAFGDLRRWSELVIGRGACAHPDGAARFVTSALNVFSREFEDHARHGLCEACARPPVLATSAQATAVS